MSEVSEEWLRDTAMNVMLATEVDEASRVLRLALAACPSPTGEKVEAVAWRWPVPAEMPQGGTKVLWQFATHWSTPPRGMAEPVYSAGTVAALVAERDRAEKRAIGGDAEICRLRSALATANARVERLDEAFRIATDALDGLSYIHDGNPSDAMADTAPVDYARHMLYEARQLAREAVANARAALTGGENDTVR